MAAPQARDIKGGPNITVFPGNLGAVRTSGRRQGQGRSLWPVSVKLVPTCCGTTAEVPEHLTILSPLITGQQRWADQRSLAAYFTISSLLARKTGPLPR